MTAHVSELHDAHKHLSEALDHLENDRPRSAKRRVELARGAVGRVLEEMGYQDPTKATGAQGSSGQTDGSTGPRSAQDWARRLFSPERTR